jgi:hypothetical protein
LRKSGFQLAALLLLGALLAANIYRAATQSFVHDEALTWQFYLSGPASDIFHTFTANNHFLATVLFKISITLFGTSEFAIRLPTVLAGAWFYWTVFRLCGLVLGDGWLFLLGCAALTLNPLLLDFFVAARGYGLATAGLFWALYEMLCWFYDRSNGVAEQILHKRLWKAALGCSIAVATNLTFVIPVFILAAAFCVLIVRSVEKPAPAAAKAPVTPSKARKKGKKSHPEAARLSSSPYTPLIHFIVPVILLAVVFLLAAPIDLARSGDFYAGLSTAMQSLRDLVDSSFAYGSARALQKIERISANFALIFLPASALAALVVALLMSEPIAQKTRSMVELTTLLASLTTVGSAILLIAAHLVSGLAYPENRTGVYFIPLATLAAMGLAQMLTERPGLLRWIGFAVAIVFACFAVEFAAQWNVKSFLVWRYDADTKRIFEALEKAPKPPGEIRLGVSWVLEPSLNYYRDVRHATWLMPVQRDGVGGVRQFYAATAEDQNTPLWTSLKQIYKGPVSGTALAVPKSNQ